MSIIKRDSTKDGRQYSFSVRYKDIYGNNKRYTSVRFKTKKEALEQEAKFRIKVAEGKVLSSNKTFKEIFLEYHEYIKKDIKTTPEQSFELIFLSILGCNARIYFTTQSL